MKDLFEKYEGNKERCGFILKSGEIVELENVHPTPEQGFEIDSEEILLHMDDIDVIWHTHPDASSVLSGEDMLYMSMWPRATHAIIGNDGIRTYTIFDGAVIGEDHIAWKAG